tara:strand:+ start:128 stop:1525 length:1398 start_codon:yes stop_codon:yes gene_type:complete
MDNAHSAHLAGSDIVEQWANESLAEIHFRFLCKKDTAEPRLIDAVRRSWIEWLSHCNEMPLMVDVSNTPNFTLYPLSPSNDYVTEWCTNPVEVYTNGNILIGGKIADKDFKRLPDDGVVVKLYQEQHVQRVSFYLLDDTHHDSMEEAIKNILDNADMDDVELLSMQTVSNYEDGRVPINVDYVVPEEKVKSVSHPIFGLLPREREVAELSPCGWLKDGRDFDAYMSYLFDNGTPLPARLLGYANPDDDKDTSIAGFEEIQLGDEDFLMKLQTLYVPAGVAADGVADKSYLAGSGENKLEQLPHVYGQRLNGMVYPAWVFSSDNDVNHLTRVVTIPSLKTVNETFYAARTYPASSMFGECDGFQYELLLRESEIPTVPDLMYSGMSIVRDVESSGKVLFTLLLPTLDDQGEELAFSMGTESQAESMIEKISGCNIGDVDVDMLTDLLEENNNAGERFVWPDSGAAN